MLVVQSVGGVGSVVGQGPLGVAAVRMVAHVCFLLMTGSCDKPSVGRRQTFALAEQGLSDGGSVRLGYTRALQGVLKGSKDAIRSREREADRVVCGRVRAMHL